LTEPFEVGPWIACTGCQVPLEHVGVPAGFFRDEPLTCAECGADLDIWSALVSSLKGDFYFNAFAAIGAHSTIVQVPLVPGKAVSVDLTEHGLPEDARILLVNYTAMGTSALPVELHGNTPRRFHTTKLVVYGYPLAADNISESELSIFVTWLPRGDAESPEELLAEAVELSHLGRPRASILFANAAMESALGNVLSQRLEWAHVAQKRAEEFLSNRATYSQQLRVVLPLLTQFIDVPPLRDPVLQNLKALNKWRNKVAHGVAGASTASPSDLAQMLGAAVFGLAYLGHFGAQLAGSELPTPPVRD